jgi:hypothetical protein
VTYVMESHITDVWLTGALKADPTLTGLVAQRVYVGAAPATATAPFIVHQDQDNADVGALGQVLVMNNETRLIRVVGVAGVRGFDALVPIASRIQVVIGQARNVEVLAGVPAAPIGMVEACYRLRHYRILRESDGVFYPEMGAYYAVSTRSY